MIELSQEKREQLREACKMYPYLFFNPNPFQYRAIQSRAAFVKKDKQNIIADIPGNGTGKTVLAVNEAANIAWSAKCPWFKQSPYVNWPFPKSLRFVCDKKQFEMPDGEVWKAINFWWPKDGSWQFSKGDYSYPSSFTLPNGFSLSCMTPDQPLRAHEGVELGGVWFLEPSEEVVWNAYARAFRHGGMKVLSCTLVYCSEWIDRRVLQDESAIITYGDVMDNCKETKLDTPLGQIAGHLKRDAIESMIQSYEESERDARKAGTPIHRRGRILSGVWTPAIHVVEHDSFPSSLMFKINIDPHRGKPWCFVVGGMDAHGDLWIKDEWPKPEHFGGKLYHEIAYDNPDHGEQFYIDLLREMRDKYNAVWLVLDYKMANSPDRGNHGTSSLRGRLEDAGFSFEPQTVDVVGAGGGLSALKSALYYDRNRKVDFTNHPRLHISNQCRNSAYQIPQLSWKKSANLGGYGESEELDPKMLDFPRGIMSLLTHGAQMAGEQKPASYQERSRDIVEKLLRERQERLNNAARELIHA